jgi:putative tryptophan/tyrosine transport system substrate-binding protein
LKVEFGVVSGLGKAMRRRDFMMGIAGSAAARPRAARAQQQSWPAIGWLRPIPPTAFPETLDAFRQGLGELGYSEGRNLAFEHRWSAGHYEQLPQLAAELVEHRVSVIFTGGGAVSTLAAKKATKTIPITFVVGDDPVRAGIVNSLNRPEGNLTGITLYAFILEVKKLELLAELAPKADLIAMLRNPNAPEAESQAMAIKAAAAKLGRQMHVLSASTAGEIDSAFATLPQLRAGALLTVNDVFFNIRSRQIIALAQQYSMPVIYDLRHNAVEGGLISYGSSLAVAYRQAGVYTGRILKGEKPADLPVMQPTKFELVINLKTAKTLGLEVPTSILLRADEVIE